MEDMNKRYGRYNEDGSVTEPAVSIMTGRRIFRSGSIRERITGTAYFYRYEGAYADRITDEQRQQWRDGAPSETRRPVGIPVKKPEPSEE